MRNTYPQTVMLWNGLSTKISHDWTCSRCHTKLVPSGYPREMVVDNSLGYVCVGKGIGPVDSTITPPEPLNLS